MESIHANATTRLRVRQWLEALTTDGMDTAEAIVLKYVLDGWFVDQPGSWSPPRPRHPVDRVAPNLTGPSAPPQAVRTLPGLGRTGLVAT